MKIVCVNNYQPCHYQKGYSSQSKPIVKRSITNKQNPNFQGIEGKIKGGTTGAFIAGAITCLAVVGTPLGWVAATAAILTSEVGGAVIGGAIGNKFREKDDD